MINGFSSNMDITNANNQELEKPRVSAKSAKRTVAEKLAVAERLRDLQQALAPARAANKAERAAGKVKIRIKTR
jgi:hypothetical protein